MSLCLELDPEPAPAPSPAAPRLDPRRMPDAPGERPDPAENLGLLGEAAKRFRGCGLAPDELMSIGFDGLRNACRLYDPGKGCEISTYAMSAIYRSMARAIRDRARRVKTLQERVGGEADDPDEFAALDQLAVAPAIDLDQLLDDRASLEALAPALDALRPVRWRDLIRLRFGLPSPGAPGAGRPHTLKEIGDRLGCTRERVRQLEVKALAKLRETLERKRAESNDARWTT